MEYIYYHCKNHPSEDPKYTIKILYRTTAWTPSYNEVKRIVSNNYITFLNTCSCNSFINMTSIYQRLAAEKNHKVAMTNDHCVITNWSYANEFGVFVIRQNYGDINDVTKLRCFVRKEGTELDKSISYENLLTSIRDDSIIEYKSTTASSILFEDSFKKLSVKARLLTYKYSYNFGYNYIYTYIIEGGGLLTKAAVKK